MVVPPNSSTDPVTVEDLVSDPEHTLGSLFRHARKISRLDALLSGFTDPDTSAQYQVANVRQDRLIVVTPTAAWSTRLRMLAPQMISFLQASGFDHLRHIDIHVAPLRRTPSKPRVRRRLSPAAEQAIEQLQRLAQR